MDPVIIVKTHGRGYSVPKFNNAMIYSFFLRRGPST